MLTNTDTVRLGDIAEIYSGGTPSRANPVYWGGDIPWVKTTQIQNCLISEDDIDEWITEEGLKHSSAKPVTKGSILMAMIGQGKTRGQVAILNIDATTNQNAAAIKPNGGYDRDYIFQQLLFRYEHIRNISNASGQQNLNLEIIRSIVFPAPSLPEQTAIANLLSTWDAAIEKTEKLIAAKERQFSWLLRSLFNQQHSKNGWSKVNLIDRIVERNERSITHNQYPVLTSSRKGLFLQNDYFSKQVTSKDNTGYKIIRRGDFTFRSMSDDGIFVFNRLEICDVGIISPAYGVFHIGGIDESFFYYFLNSAVFRRELRKVTQGGTRTALKLNSIKQLTVNLPSLHNQKQIASTLNSARLEIDLLIRIVDSYRQQKRGLMQKLLTGQWRVTHTTHDAPRHSREGGNPEGAVQ